MTSDQAWIDGRNLTHKGELAEARVRRDSRQSDYIRSDELVDAAVRVSDLPRLFNVSDRTIRDWIKKDEITTFEHPVQNDTGARQLAIRWGDIPSTTSDTTRWKRR